jgi:hypothetical protein
VTCPSKSSGMVAIPKFYKSCRRVLVGLRSKTSLVIGHALLQYDYSTVKVW